MASPMTLNHEDDYIIHIFFSKDAYAA